MGKLNCAVEKLCFFFNATEVPYYHYYYHFVQVAVFLFVVEGILR